MSVEDETMMRRWVVRIAYKRTWGGRACKTREMVGEGLVEGKYTEEQAKLMVLGIASAQGRKGCRVIDLEMEKREWRNGLRRT